MNEMKVSVIIPVYNAEEYLDRCVQSVLAQTYQRFEVILVDDGSTDSCPALCDKYSSDARFKVLHKVNEGQAKARNIGLDMSDGDLICFVDSDDCIRKDMFEYCVILIEKYAADAVLFDCMLSEDKRPSFPEIADKITLLDEKNIMRYFMEQSTMNSKLYSLCLCIYRRSALGGLRFREGRIYEDNDFKFKFMSCCHTVVVSNQILYYYYVSGDSTTSGKLGRKNFQLREADEIIYELAQQSEDAKVRWYGRVKKARTAFSLLGRMARYGVNENEIDEKVLASQLVKEHRRNLQVLLMAPIGLKRKVLAVLLAFSYPLAKVLTRCQRRLY